MFNFFHILDLRNFFNLPIFLIFNLTFKKLIPSSENLFTWWSYRSPDFRLNNRGRRLDHIWINKKSSLKLIKAKIIKEYRELEKPSDHVPVVLELSF